jgi:ABC-type uncharacterized transport system substrate-binding protein
MHFLVRHLALGLFLIGLASAVLLLGDRPRADDAASKAGKKWNIHLLEYVNILDVEEAERGIKDGLRQAGLVEGVDYSLTVRNSQGDMPTLNSLVQAALSDRADLILTLTTPALQAAMRQTTEVPIVFTYVADPFLAGAGKTDADHRPNVTGIYVPGAYAEVVGVLHECLPNARTVGTLFVPTEVNSVYHKDQTTATAKKLGIDVEAVPVATATEMPDAARALCARRLDAVCQVGGNLTASCFGSISQAARQQRLPVFAFLSSQAHEGAAAVVARDYYDAGRETALVAARVVRGEKPAAIPLAPFEKNRLIVNLPAARACGLMVPQSVIRRADEVIGR